VGWQDGKGANLNLFGGVKEMNNIIMKNKLLFIQVFLK